MTPAEAAMSTSLVVTIVALLLMVWYTGLRARSL